jgi:hypothetical protein
VRGDRRVAQHLLDGLVRRRRGREDEQHQGEREQGLAERHARFNRRRPPKVAVFVPVRTTIR